jgi:hypothetical protein
MRVWLSCLAYLYESENDQCMYRVENNEKRKNE